MLTRFRQSLGARGILFFCLCLFVILTGMTMLNVFYQKYLLKRVATEHSLEIANLILTSMRHPMLSGDQDVIQKQFDAYKLLPGIEVVHLTDKNGIIRRSTDRSLIGDKPLTPDLESALKGEEHHGVAIRLRTKRMVVAELVPILNEPKCYSCHGSKDKVLGVVRLALDWEKIQKALKANTNWNILLSIAGLIIMSLLIAVFFLKTIVFPIRNLKIGMQKVSQGNLDLKLPVGTKDEIGNLTILFNKMAVDLKTLMEKEQALNLSLKEEVAERKKAEETLRETQDYLENLFSYANAPIIVWGSDFVITRFNHAFEELTGISAEEAIGKRLEILFPEESCETSMDMIKKTLSGERWEVVEIPIRRKSGEVRTVLWNSANVIGNDRNTIIATIAQGQDITERKQAEEALRTAYVKLKQTQAQLVQSAKMASVGQLAGGVAHEINNPLTGILNNVQLIKMLAEQKKEFNLDDFKELLQVIEESAVRCTGITRALLDFSCSSKDEKQDVSLNEIIEKVYGLIENDLKLNNITIKKELDPGLPMVSGDLQLLQQVVFDIISNAKWAILNKTGKLGGLITIKTEYDAKNHSIYVNITDTGIGIPKENLERIFDPFFTTKPMGEGTGLGLSIVYSIIKDHQGSLEVQSEPGQGTSFKVTLPAA